jgi:hypothetical protein
LSNRSFTTIRRAKELHHAVHDHHRHDHGRHGHHDRYLDDLIPAYANLWRSVKTGLFSRVSAPESL